MSKRAWTELNKLQGLSLTGSSPVKFIIDSSPFGNEDSASSTSNTFIGRILPTSDPFNQSALKVELKLPGKYPVDPPEVRVLTPIHHPNVLDDGKSKKKLMIVLFYISNRLCLSTNFKN